MKEHVDHVVCVMDTNRRRHGKHWTKVRLDRLHKLFPKNVDHDTLLEMVKNDPRVKLTMKEVDENKNELVPALKLRGVS